MPEVKLTKNELRIQQSRLAQLEKYLPTLQLKKALLQAEVNEARVEIAICEKQYAESYADIEEHGALLSGQSALDLRNAAKITKVGKRYENIAGIVVPYFDFIEFEPFTYSLFETPPWVDPLILQLRVIAESGIRIKIAQEKAYALEKELREVSIRVNLFEKILIPRALGNIKKIKVFLGDQQLSAVSQAKVAKNKIVKNKLLAKQQELLHAR